MSVVAYPQPGKAKSAEILGAFIAGARAQGAGGQVVHSPHVRRLQDGAAAFYGTVAIEQLFDQARWRAEACAGDYYYLDNAYFDRGRGQYFRISLNALQRARPRPHSGRLERLGIEIQPWRKSGKHVLVVEQSDYFMRELAGWRGGLEQWRHTTIKAIELATDRPIVVRRWLRDKTKASSTLAEDLAGAWAVVVHSSAAANEALLAGIPIVCHESCVAIPFSSKFGELEDPRRPDGREEWAARLAASQWTLHEMRAGVAWRALQEQPEEATQ